MTEQQMIRKAEEDGFNQFEIPSNDNARWYMMIMYDRGIGKALEGIFDFYASGINFKAAYTNGRPFLDFVDMRIKSDDQLLNTSDSFGPRLYYYEQISHISRLLKDYEQTNASLRGADLINITTDKSDIAKIQRASKAENYTINMQTIKTMFSIIKSLWDILFCNHTYTYRYLSALCSVCDFPNTENSRRSLIRILRTTSSEW